LAAVINMKFTTKKKKKNVTFSPEIQLIYITKT